MKLLHVLIIAYLSMITSGCSIREREQAMEKKTEELNQKEQQLLLKEKQLQLKEEELLALQYKMDSSLLTDSLAPIDVSLVGTWSVRMRCTETTCPGSAVGDVKTETWEINYQDRNLIAKAYDGKNLIRVYAGPYRGNQTQLTTQTELDPSPNTTMVVTLQKKINNAVEGRREIIRSGECKIVYALELKKL